MKLIEELKRRNVFRVGAAYVLLGWVVIQVTDTVTPAAWPRHLAWHHRLSLCIVLRLGV
jgi:hypothetical protein